MHLSGCRPSTFLWPPLGIWTRDLKSRTNLQQAQITKVLKQLETRRLVKSIRPVSEPSKKFYISFDIEPSTEITGGAWWVAALRCPGSCCPDEAACLALRSLQYRSVGPASQTGLCWELLSSWCWGVLLPCRSESISHHPDILQGRLVRNCCPMVCCVGSPLPLCHYLLCVV